MESFARVRQIQRMMNNFIPKIFPLHDTTCRQVVSRKHRKVYCCSETTTKTSDVRGGRGTFSMLR